MTSEGAKLVGLRNEFYKDNYRKTLVILAVSMLINLALVSGLVCLLLNPPKPKYFATSINGRITPIVPLNQPNQSDSAVLQWASQAAVSTFTYSFVNYREELQAASEFFTPQGWREFLRALSASNNLEAVRTKRLVVSAVLTQAPVILDKGIMTRGTYSWRIQMPVVVTYQSASEFSQQRNIVTMLVTRVSTLNTPRGIGISQFVVSPQGGGITAN